MALLAFGAAAFSLALVQVNTANNQAFTGTVRLRWNYRPDSDLYIIYTAGQRFASLETNAPGPLT